MNRRMREVGSSLTFQVLCIAIASRIGLAMMNWFTLKVFRVFDRGYPKLYDELIPADHLLGGWSRWDSAWYALVAFEGYAGPIGEPVQTRGFFPLYPILIRAMAALNPGADTRSDYAVWGVVLANICFLAFVVLLAHTIALKFDRDIALTAVALLVVSPMSFFFNAGYSESLFMLCTVAAFWFSYNQRWIPASAAIALASATRLFGLALIPCILLIAWRHRAALRDLATIAVGGSLGTLAFFLWMWAKYDDVTAYFQAQSTFWGTWHDRLGAYLDIIGSEPSLMLTNPENFIISLNLGLALIALATLPLVWRTIEPGMALFTTIIVVFHCVYTWHSLGRYLLAAIGVYIVMAMVLHRPSLNTGVRTAVIVTSSVVLATLNVLFAHGFWIV